MNATCSFLKGFDESFLAIMNVIDCSSIFHGRIARATVS
jgi:hypothetical protein